MSREVLRKSPFRYFGTSLSLELFGTNERVQWTYDGNSPTHLATYSFLTELPRCPPNHAPSSFDASTVNEQIITPEVNRSNRFEAVHILVSQRGLQRRNVGSLTVNHWKIVIVFEDFEQGVEMISASRVNLPCKLPVSDGLTWSKLRETYWHWTWFLDNERFPIVTWQPPIVDDLDRTSYHRRLMSVPRGTQSDQEMEQEVWRGRHLTGEKRSRSDRHSEWSDSE